VTVLALAAPANAIGLYRTALKSVPIGLCLVGMMGPAFARDIASEGPCGGAPPMSARKPPTVPYRIYAMPSARVQTLCAHGERIRFVWACEYPQADGSAIIVINGEVSKKEQACLLVYEKAHLPPNNWFDIEAEMFATYH